MNCKVYLVLISLLLTVACSYARNELAKHGEIVGDDAATIVYREGGFSPGRLEIEIGTQVVFVNDTDTLLWPASNIHPTHQIFPEFDSMGSVPPGDRWGFTFKKAGFWRYHNHLWPDDAGLIVATGDGNGPRIEPLVIEVYVSEFQTPTGVKPEDYIELLVDDELVKEYLRKFGPAHTASLIADAGKRTNVICHDRAHDVGRFAYEMYGAVAFAISSHECEAGAYHGATEALFQRRGTANLEADVEIICGDTDVFFYRLQCLHGVGHGLMAWTSYELFDALDLCDNLAKDRDQRACYSGVFMENVVGGLSGNMGHFTNYVSEDAHYPCNALDDRYVGPCYLFHSTRMLTLFEYDYGKVSGECSVVPEFAVDDCFDSFGRDIAAITLGDPGGAIEMCGSHVPDLRNRIFCLQGTLQARFWETSKADEALSLCGMLKDDLEERSACYWMLIIRAIELYRDDNQYLALCARLEEPFDAWCERRTVPGSSGLSPANREFP